MNGPTPQTITHADIKTIAAALGIVNSSAADRASKEAWPFIEQPGRGGKKRLYPLATLPNAVRDRVVIYLLHKGFEYEHKYDGTGEGRINRGVFGVGDGADDIRAEAAVSCGRKAGHAAHHGTARLDSGREPAGTAGTRAISDRKQVAGNGSAATLIPTGVDRVERGSNLLVDNQGSGSCEVVVGRPAGRLGQFVNSGRRKQNLEDLPESARECNEARARIHRFVREYPESAKKAIDYLNEHYEHIQGMKWAYERAWDKPRGNVLVRDTLNKWISIYKETGLYAPLKHQKLLRIEPWHALAIELRKRPQGSTVKWIHAQLEIKWNDTWGKLPSYDAVNNFFKNEFSQIDQLKGRYTGSALRSHKFYQHRTSEGLAPAMEVHADGWNTHFTAPHPVTGEFVTYEVWHYHDVCTRYATPPGLGLTENFEVIAKGLENYIRVFGVPLIVMTDSTKIIRGSARFTKDPVRSIEERVGCTITHPKEVGNSQANGICENFNTSYLDKRSRELATYQSKGQMDELTFKRVKKLTAAMVKAANAGDLAERDQKKREAERMGKGLVFTSHAEAVEWLNRIHTEYNDRPHRSLPKVRCPQNGRLRHQTPAEALAEHRANGWEPTLMGDTREAHEAFLVDTFRPRAIVKVARETVSPYGGMRFRNAEALGHWNGKEVVVVYDIHDWQSVRVEDMKGALICMAEFVAATGYRAVTAYEDAEEKRAKAQIRRREKQIEQIEARTPAAAIEAPVKTIVDFLDVTPQPAPERELTIADFLPAVKQQEQESSYSDTVMWLHGGGKKPDEPKEEVAAR